MAVIYFINILLPLGFVLPLLRSGQTEVNGKLFIAWYFETCNFLLRLFRAIYNPKGKVLRFVDRKKQNKNKNHYIVQKATSPTSKPNITLLKGQKHINNSRLRFAYNGVWSHCLEQLQTLQKLSFCLTYYVDRTGYFSSKLLNCNGHGSVGTIENSFVRVGQDSFSIYDPFLTGSQEMESGVRLGYINWTCVFKAFQQCLSYLVLHDNSLNI